MSEKEKTTQRIELPKGMTPDQAVRLLTHRLNRYISDMRRFSCVNAVITSKEPSYDFDTQTIHPGDVIFDDTHCKNARRHGSKFCESCAATKDDVKPTVKIAPPKRIHYSRKKRKALARKKHGIT
jgi:hypothetical protein